MHQMDSVNAAKELPPISGSAVRGFFRCVGWLTEHPAIGIPVGINLICVLIVVVCSKSEDGGASKRDSNRPTIVQRDTLQRSLIGKIMPLVRATMPSWTSRAIGQSPWPIIRCRDLTCRFPWVGAHALNPGVCAENSGDTLLSWTSRE